jgi:hypothetical protein
MKIEIVFPFESTIYGDSYKDAIKKFIKLNHNMNITKMIIKDQSKNIEAKMNYYKEDGRNKVGIDMFPVGLQYPIPVITNDSSQPPFPLSPIPLSPFPSPFIPTVINIPNI